MVYVKTKGRYWLCDKVLIHIRKISQKWQLYNHDFLS